MEARSEVWSGHYTQTDPIGIAGGLNTYGYAGGDPVNFSDPFGLCPHCVGAVIGAVSELAIQGATGSWSGQAVVAAAVAGGISGGLSVGGGLLRVGLQAGASVVDGWARAGFRGDSYGAGEVFADAVGGAAGELAGEAARGALAVGREAVPVVVRVGRRASGVTLGTAGELYEAVPAAAAGGTAGAIVGALTTGEEDEKNR